MPNFFPNPNAKRSQPTGDRLLDAGIEAYKALDLADILMRTLAPKLWMETNMELMKQKNPKMKIYSDARAGYSGIEDRLLTKSPGVVDAIIERDEGFRADVEHGPLTGKELDKIILDMMEDRSKETFKTRSIL
jgi:hypothetical protein